MYADRYAGQPRPSAGGIAFALGVSGVVLFGLSLMTTNVARHIETVLVATSIEADKPPPPVDPAPPKTQTHVVKQPTAPIDPVDVTKSVTTIDAGTFADTRIELAQPGGVTVGSDTEIGTVIPPHVPVLRDPTLDSRYVDNFQPGYPSDERLAGREGRVVVSVLIGTDGRVKDVRQISAASTAFFEATRRQALARWRFRPGTKDGEPVEAWHTMAVRFVIDAE